MSRLPRLARLSTESTSVLVVDVQEKLIPKIEGSTSVIRNIAFLLDGCSILGVPTLGTEQYPKGLGNTVPELAQRLPAKLPEKTAFSCCAVPEVIEQVTKSGRDSVIIAGIESHVCVMQTVLDLLALSTRVFIAIDAIGSRYRIDHDTAIRRMENAGAVPITVEMALFELTRIASGDSFKSISRLVQQRMKSMSEPETQ